MAALVTSLLVLGTALWKLCLAVPEVTCPWGTVSGVDWSAGPGGLPYQAFLAIPYALPPTGPRRFQRPQPHPGGNETFQAREPGRACPQALLHPDFTTEDCLTLNVFRPPSASPASPRPVLVWVHGGGFTVGAATTYDPWRLVAVNGLVFVSIQYRLGPLGFLSTGSDRLPGNLGLWDQVLALQWVKDNIAAFGGDPDKVTLMGESAGSASVTHLLLSPRTDGLFHRVIGQSGSPNVVWANVLEPAKAAMRLAEEVGCPRDPPEYDSMVACLRGKDADELVQKGKPPEWGFWYPTPDGDLVAGNPRELLHNASFLQALGSFFARDLLMGVNNNEGLALIMGPQVEPSSALMEKLVSDFLTQTYGSFNPDIVAATTWKYTASSPQPDVTLQEMMDATGHLQFLAPIVEYTRAHARQGPGRTYAYLFDYFPEGVLYGGMGHAQDTAFLFSPAYNLYNTSWDLILLKGTLDARDEKVTQTFAKFLADFARSGNPGPALAGNLPSGEWPPFEMVNQSYLAFSNASQVRTFLGDATLSFHLDLVPRLQGNWESLWVPSPQPPTHYPHTTPPPRKGELLLTPAQSNTLAIAFGVVAAVLLIVACVAVVIACKQAAASKYRMN